MFARPTFLCDGGYQKVKIVDMSYRSDEPPRMNRSNSNDCRLYVGNLPDDVRTRDVEDAFYKYGSIKDVELKLPKGRGTPYAFVEFDDPRY